MNNRNIAHFHLPGLFEFYEFYREFLALYHSHREYFYDWCDIGSIYGAPAECLWGGGRAGYGDAAPEDVLSLMIEHQISARLTFSNLLLKDEHLSDRRCNRLCRMFSSDSLVKNGVIVASDLLSNYLHHNFPQLYQVSSTTKVITDFEGFISEATRSEFIYVVPDFRLNKKFDELKKMPQSFKDKVEFLCNECCDFDCRSRRACYEAVSLESLGLKSSHKCASSNAAGGYSFARAMDNPAFISLADIKDVYLPMGFTNYKIEGRSLGSALLLEFILYYMTRPQYHIHVREALYLDNTLDLF